MSALDQPVRVPPSVVWHDPDMEAVNVCPSDVLAALTDEQREALAVLLTFHANIHAAAGLDARQARAIVDALCGTTAQDEERRP